MARKEARITVEIWDHDRFKDLSFGGQWLYMTILSQADLSFCGVLTPATPWWATLAKDATQRQVERWLAELHAADFVVHDVAASQVLVTGLIRRDGVLDRANLVVALSRAYGEVRSVAIRRRIMAQLEDIYPNGVMDALTEKWDKAGKDDKSIADRMHHRMVDDITNGIRDTKPVAVHGPSTEVTEVTDIALITEVSIGGDDSRVPLQPVPRQSAPSSRFQNTEGHISASLSAFGVQR